MDCQILEDGSLNLTFLGMSCHLPPLRERREDIPDLVAYLLEKINRELRKNVRKVPPEVMNVLMELPWKGNVRELENALTRAVILAKGDVVLKENLPLEAPDKEVFPRELVPLEEVEKRMLEDREKNPPIFLEYRINGIIL